VDHEKARRQVLMVQLQGEHLFKNCPQWKREQGDSQRKNRPGQRPVQDLLALRRREMQQGDLATTEVEWTVDPPVADEEPGSEASECQWE